ncbi:MAG: phage antirepressor KilAC domain-containing protein [Gallionellaceae bacterium]|jgi:phage antirepressor YoqD-like protein
MLQIKANEQKMSSREIAELTGKRHDNVKRLMTELANQEVISYPQIEGGNKSANGVTEKLFMVNQRDSYIVVAQLSPEFTGKLVDRWRELESQKISLPNFNDPVEAARAWADAKESENSAVLKLEAVKPQLEFHTAVTEAINAQSIEEVAKVLGTGRNRLFNWLRSQYLLQANNLPYQEHIDRQYFRVTENAYKDKKGEAHTYTRTLITGKGLAYIQSRFMAEAA